MINQEWTLTRVLKTARTALEGEQYQWALQLSDLLLDAPNQQEQVRDWQNRLEIRISFADF